MFLKPIAITGFLMQLVYHSYLNLCIVIYRVNIYNNML